MKHRRYTAVRMLLLASLLGITASQAQDLKNPARDSEKTAFQTSGQWKPATDTRADMAIVYGVNDNRRFSFEERVQSWRDRGYKTAFMTGIAWGTYQDYFTGEWDGINHMGEGQVTQAGDTISHGYMVPYIVPTASFIQYMKERHIRRVIDAGIDAIFMEEPEFWNRGGYSSAFKKEWERFYGFPWRPQHESPENTYLANKLKYQLYYNALDEVFTYAKAYGKTKGMDVKCYVPTHSLVNYTSWSIVSPEASLASLPCVDGYIAQVWTGTSREPVFYDGIRKERVFENAFLEYGSMESMTRPTGRKMFFLTDPIEDRAKDWGDYKRNYQATFAAQLLYPMIADYEVMPWPDRIYEGRYRMADSDERQTIPRYYSTQMQVMINTLNDMPLSDNRVSGSHGIGVMMSNSLMFQRFPDHAGYEDPQLSSFYGQTLPLLKRGVPVSTVHVENVAYPDTWNGLRVLVLSYSNMKPMKESYHQYIADWVRRGGQLVYCGKDIDPYQTVMEWWNTGSNNYIAPSGHLFEQMGMDSNPESGEYSVGAGRVYIIREEPKNFILNAGGDEGFFNIVRKAYESKGDRLETKNSFLLERGYYTIAAVLDESVSNKPLALKGILIDLFDPELPVLRSVNIAPGQQGYFFDVSKVSDKKIPQVLCGASRVYDEKIVGRTYSFVAKSPANTTNVSRVLLPSKPSKIQITNPDGVVRSLPVSWDVASKTVLLRFENYPDGVEVRISW